MAYRPKRQIRQVTVEFPEAFKPLWQPARYKIMLGGRGGGRSWSTADYLLICGLQKPLRVLCARELQKSIADSVHALLSDRIKALGLEHHYTILKSEITGANGTRFYFAGLKSNVDAIKSAEAVDKVWIEEADNVSHDSWEVLIPSVRAPGSEILMTFNPQLESDATWQRFVKHPPPDSITIRTTWRDNPWFPEVLDQERKYLKETDYQAYLHVWEGNCTTTVEGAIFSKELGEAEAAGRMTHIPYDPAVPVSTYWDLGFADNTAIWFVQSYPYEHRLIDYLEGSQLPLSWYQKRLQDRPYVYRDHCLPHDATAHQLGTGRSVQELMVSAGFKVRIVPKLSVQDRIQAARVVFPLVWFDATRCADGLQALRHYRWAPESKSSVTGTAIRHRDPLHDWASNGSDAFTEFAVGLKPVLQGKPTQQHDVQRYISAWS